MRLLVCGNRTVVGDEWRACVEAFLAAIDRTAKRRGVDVTLIHGAQRTRDPRTRETIGGADWFADRIGRELGWTIEAHPADWRAHGDAAGPNRNEFMSTLDVDRGLAFGKLRKRPTAEKRSGTGGMVDLLNERGVLVTIVSDPSLRPW